MNSCVNSPEDGPVGPKHVEIRRYMNKIETVTSDGFSFLILVIKVRVPVEQRKGEKIVTTVEQRRLWYCTLHGKQ